MNMPSWARLLFKRLQKLCKAFLFLFPKLANLPKMPGPRTRSFQAARKESEEFC